MSLRMFANPRRTRPGARGRPAGARVSQGRRRPAEPGGPAAAGREQALPTEGAAEVASDLAFYVACMFATSRELVPGACRAHEMCGPAWARMEAADCACRVRPGSVSERCGRRCHVVDVAESGRLAGRRAEVSAEGARAVGRVVKQLGFELGDPPVGEADVGAGGLQPLLQGPVVQGELADALFEGGALAGEDNARTGGRSQPNPETGHIRGHGVLPFPGHPSLTVHPLQVPNSYVRTVPGTLPLSTNLDPLRQHRPEKLQQPDRPGGFALVCHVGMNLKQPGD